MRAWWRALLSLAFMLSQATAFPLFAEVSREGERGLFDHLQTGFPARLWDDARINEAITMIGSARIASNPLINQQKIILLLSGSEPALSGPNSQRFSAARLAFLISIGALDQAEALALEFDWQDPGIRKYAEQIALLTTRSEAYCDALLGGEFTEIETGMRIYCLMRDDGWDEAHDEFERLRGERDPARIAALASYLDLDEETASNTPWVTLPGPFDFVLGEAIGRVRGEAPLPPSYLYYSLETGVSSRADIDVVETLVGLGALPPPNLFAAYRAGRASRGNAAEDARLRAEITRGMDAITAPDLPRNFDNFLAQSIRHFSQKGLLSLFAQEMASRLSLLDIGAIEDARARRNLLRLGLVGGWSQAGWHRYIEEGDNRLMLAYHLRHSDASGEHLARIAMPRAEVRVILDAFYGKLQPRFGEEAPGEAIWAALDILDDIHAHSDEDVAGAFQTLVINGQDSFAREIALAILLGDEE